MTDALKSRAHRVLIVDDEPSVRKATQLVLARAGFDARMAPTVVDAVQLSRDWPPDLILLDLAMPLMHGMDGVGLFKAEPATRDALIVAHTGYVSPEDTDMLGPLGFGGFILKPADPGELPRQLAAMLAARSRSD